MLQVVDRKVQVGSNWLLCKQQPTLQPAQPCYKTAPSAGETKPLVLVLAASYVRHWQRSGEHGWEPCLWFERVPLFPPVECQVRALLSSGASHSLTLIKCHFAFDMGIFLSTIALFLLPNILRSSYFPQKSKYIWSHFLILSPYFISFHNHSYIKQKLL